MKELVERYAVSIYILLDIKLGKLDCNGYTYIGSYDIDGVEELIEFILYFNDKWYKIEIQNCGEGDKKYTANMAIDKINETIKFLENEKETC